MEFPIQLKSVIFDLDDTLIDWSGQSVSWSDFLQPRTEKIHQFLTGKGLNLPDENQFHLLIEEAVSDLWKVARETLELIAIGPMMQKVFTDLDPNADQVDINEVLVQFNWQPFPGVKVFEETHEVLEKLKEKGYHLGLLTNSFLPMWMRDIELKSYGLIDCFDARFTAADIGYIKPHPAIFRAILSELDTSPKEAVFVGDRPKNDIAGANGIGMKSILFDPPHLDWELDGVVPDYTLNNLAQLPPLLASIDLGK